MCYLWSRAGAYVLPVEQGWREWRGQPQEQLLTSHTLPETAKDLTIILERKRRHFIVIQ
jgi:hypothetical protein